jgi:hypothetical protein
MGRKRRPPQSERIKTVKRSSLAIGLAVGFAFSMIMGVTAGAMGLGSLYPQLNLVVGPLVCRNGQMTYSQQISEVGPARYYTAKWHCVDEPSGERSELDPNTVFLLASPVYGLPLFVILLVITYFYWNSSIGPAKNDGLRLW